MNLTRIAKLGVVLLGTLTLSVSTFGNEVEVTAKTDLFGQGKNKKPTKVGTALPGSKYKVISTKGAWTAINFNGKSVWIASKNVRPVDGEYASNEGGDREPASWGGSSESKYSVHADLAVQTGGSGFGPGFGGWFKVHKFSPTMVLDVGPSLFFFPSTAGSTAGASASAFQIMVNGRLRYSVAPKMHLNGELGLVYLNASATTTVPVLGTVSASSSSIGVNLGGSFLYEFAKQWNGVAGLRMVFAGGTAALISGGVEYSF